MTQILVILDDNSIASKIMKAIEMCGKYFSL